MMRRWLGFFERVDKEESPDEYLDRTPDGKLLGYGLRRKKRIRFPPEYASMSHGQRLDWQEAHITKPWCVCQDLSPFLISFSSQHDSEEQAWRAVSGEFLTVYRTEYAHRVNRRLVEDEDYFEKELDKTSRKNNS